MKFTRWIGLIALPSAVFLVALCPAVRADTVLADWEVAATGTIFPGGDFDSNHDNSPSCSGCWYSNKASTSYSQSTGATGATSGTHGLQATIVGKGLGGSYAPIINGVPVTLQTHFDTPLIATYSNNPAANGGVLDPRFTAIEAAVDGNQTLYTIDFDITYDVAEMRSIPWQPPEQTTPPPAPDGPPFDYANRYPQRFFWIGMLGQANDSYQFVGFDANNINAFAQKWDMNLFPVFHASFPLSAFNFVPNSSSTFYNLGFLYNSVFGTSPASSNTSGVHIYFDNLVLKQFNPVTPIDFNHNGVADPEDWSLFMSQYGVAGPTFGDLVGNFGAFGTNGKVDFADLQKFQTLYHAANPGAGALGPGVPEPGTIALAALALLGLVVSRARRFARPAITLGFGFALAFTHQAAQAQLLESFETLGKWAANPGAAAGANPSVALSTTGATQGTKSLKITAHDTSPIGGFSWNAATVPTNWVAGDSAFAALKSAIRIGAEHYNLLIDTTFNPADLPGVNSLFLTLGLNFNGQNAGVYSGEIDPFTTTTTIPLSGFNLPDTVDQGTNNYSAQFGFTATADVDPFSVYVDNIRLEQISTPDLLTLEINRSNGAGTLKNLTMNPISWNYMDIKSAGGLLDPVGWSSLDDQNADGAGTWIEAGGASGTDLVEASLLGSHTLAAGATLPIGNLYNNPLNARDLVGLVIRKAAGPTNRTYDQLVTYVGAVPPPAVPGDYNNNGLVDSADYPLWRDHLGSGFQLLNEGGISPGIVDQADYDFWKSRFGAISGSGSGLAGNAAVPEPSALVLWMCAVLAAWAGRRTRIA